MADFRQEAIPFTPVRAGEAVVYGSVARSGCGILRPVGAVAAIALLRGQAVISEVARLVPSAGAVPSIDQYWASCKVAKILASAGATASISSSELVCEEATLGGIGAASVEAIGSGVGASSGAVRARGIQNPSAAELLILLRRVRASRLTRR